MQRQIILITCAAFLIPEVLILTISELFFVKHIRERYDVLIEAEETRVSSVMFDMTFTAYNVCQDLTYDAGVISFFKRKTPASDSATLEKSLLIKAAKDRLPMLLSMTVYTDNSNIGSQGNIIHLDDLAGEDWYRKSDRGQWSSWIISDVRMNRVYTQPCLTLVQKINTLGADTEAYLVAVVSYDYMKNRLGTSGYSLMMTTGPEESFYATEHQNIGAVLPWHDFDGTTYARYHGLTGEGKNRKLTYLNAFTPFATKSKIYIQVIDPDAVHNIRVLQGTFIMITVLAIVMPFLMILIATGELDRRVSQLRNSMHRISLGDYEIMGQFSGDDELTDIFRDLKTTADNIREREKAYYQEIIQNQQLTNRQQQIEYKMLESQINPHYLYNTLEMIRMQALSHRDIAVGNSVLMGQDQRPRPAGPIAETDYDDGEDLPDERSSRKKKKTGGSKKKAPIIIIASIVAALVVALGICYALGMFGGKEIEAPDFSGLSVKEAEQLAEENDLKIKEGDPVFTDEVEAGLIVNQDPEAGTTIKTGSSITVFVSGGPGDGEVPDVVGQDEEEAQEEIESAGFKCKITTQASEKNAGTIISQDPAGGTQAEKGSTVNLVASDGSLARSTMPYLKGKTLAEAESALENANLKLAVKNDADLDALKASQQQTDAQFEDAARLDAVLLPQLRQAIGSNTRVSAELTKRIEQELAKQRGENNDTNSNGTSGELEGAVTDSKDSRKNDGGLTDEQKKQVEDLLKANQPSTDTNPSTNTQTDKGSRKPQTSKPW